MIKTTSKDELWRRTNDAVMHIAQNWGDRLDCINIELFARYKDVTDSRYPVVNAKYKGYSIDFKRRYSEDYELAEKFAGWSVTYTKNGSIEIYRSKDLASVVSVWMDHVDVVISDSKRLELGKEKRREKITRVYRSLRNLFKGEEVSRRGDKFFLNGVEIEKTFTGRFNYGGFDNLDRWQVNGIVGVVKKHHIA